MAGAVLGVAYALVGPLSAAMSAEATGLQPSVEFLSVTGGSTAGGTVVDIYGSNLSGSTEVRFGDAAAAGGSRAQFRINADSMITAVSPPHAAGVADVTVVGPGGTSATLQGDRFSYAYGSWAPTAVSNNIRPTGTAMVLDGPQCHPTAAAPPWCDTVLVAGGRTAKGNVTAAVEVYDPRGAGGAGVWQVANPMITAREHHTATLLGDGRVLVTGGLGANGSLANAEVYDPRTSPGVWIATGVMHHARFGHAATAIGNGRVLVTGGDTGGGATDSDEVYDASTSSWLSAAAMAVPRRGHTATFLDGPACRNSPSPRYCGQVMVTGGTDPSNAAAELFDPTAQTMTPLIGSWTKTGKAQQYRSHHSATLLDGNPCRGWSPPEYCGKVLVTGGDNQQADSELYDPAVTFDGVAGKWGNATATSVTSVSDAPVSTALLPDGRVLAVGARRSNTASFGAELYDGVLGNWQPAVPPSSDFHGGLPATLLGDGSVLVAQGVGSGSSVPLAERWSLVMHPPAPVVTGVSPGSGPYTGASEVTVTGTGLFPASSVRFGDSAALRVSFNSDTALVVASPPHTPAIVDVSVVVARPSGSVDSGLMAADRYAFIATHGEWRTTNAMDSCTNGPGSLPGCGARYDQTATQLDGPACRSSAPPAYCGRVLVVGGTPYDAPLRTAEVYDPISETWAATGSMSAARGSYWSTHTATLLDPGICHREPVPQDYPCGRVLVVGGENQQLNFGTDAQAELYDPSVGTWTQVGRPHTPSFGHIASLLDGPACRVSGLLPGYCGEVLVAGGNTANDGFGVPTAVAELFNPRALYQLPATGSTQPSPTFWTAAAPMQPCQSGSQSCVARDGPGVLLDGPSCHGNSPPGYCGRVLAMTGLVDAHAIDAAGKPKVVYTSSAQTYDPSGTTTIPATDPHAAPTPYPGIWRPTGSLAIPRVNFTETVLDGPLCRQPALPTYCGGVLIAGGETPGPTVNGLATSPEGASAEVYDPAAPGFDSGRAPVLGAWHGVGSMNEARSLHTATLMTSGLVLMTGGGSAVDSGDPVTHRASVEAFDPAAGTWTETAPMASARGQHAATLLEGAACARPMPPAYCGRVLVDGGGDSSAKTSDGVHRATSTAEVYTPGPEVLQLAPRTGPNSGGTSVVMTGAGFDAASTVTVGGVPAQGLTVQSPTQLTFTTPARALPGAADVVVRGSTGASPYVPAKLAALFTYDGCNSQTASGQIAYAAGAYSLVGVPDGTTVPADSHLYGWLDVGGGGTYTAQDPSTSRAVGGRAYWAWFACARPITLAVGAQVASSALGGLHASMIGNPSGVNPAVASGYDFAALWDAQAQRYTISGYREAVTLGVGTGAWVFSYLDTTIHIQAG